MSKRVEIVVLIVLAVVCGMTFWHFLDHDIVPAFRFGSSGPNGVVIDAGGIAKIIASLVGASGFSIASIVAIWNNFAKLLPSGPVKWWGSVAADSTTLALYQQAYEAARKRKTLDSKQDASRLAEMKAIREAARISSDNLFNEMFPLEEGGAA